MENWEEMKKEFYGTDALVTIGSGLVNFNKAKMKSVDTKGITFKSYDEYLEIQKNSCGKNRRYFEMCYYTGDMYCDFKGQIERFDRKNGKVVFKRIMVDGIFSDGCGYKGKEEHVWMDIKGFEIYSENECLKFSAEIHRYLKTKNGKLIDYDLRNPEDISKIEKYEVPTDEDLIDQQIKQLICETCRYQDQCYCGVNGMCFLNKQERNERFETLKNFQPGKFTILTVMLAYELEYRIFYQMGGIKLFNKTC